MKKISDRLLRAAEFILGMAGVAMILIETYSVFCRNVTHWSTPWVDEVLRLIFVWIVFIGAAVAYKADDLISLTLVEDTLKSRGKAVPHNILKLIQYVLALTVGVMLTQQELATMLNQMQTGESTAITGYPVWIKSCGILIGFVILVVIIIAKIVRLLRNFDRLPQ